MFHLTREIRFAINDRADRQLDAAPTNGYAGYPSLNGLGRFFTLAITLAGDLEARSNYLRNIRDIDAVARRVAIGLVEETVMRRPRGSSDFQLPAVLLAHLRDQWPGVTLHEVRLGLSPFTFLVHRHS